VLAVGLGAHARANMPSVNANAESCESGGGVTASARFELFGAAGRGMEWRFMAANNYVLAVGGDRMADFAAARLTLAGLQCALPQASWALYQDPAEKWRWDLRSFGAVLAKSSRWYHSRAVCESTLAQFLDDAPEARVVDTGKLLRKVVDLRVTGDDRPLGARILSSGIWRFGRQV
jgi:uncharacterized protein YegP (UPF0339 family)